MTNARRYVSLWSQVSPLGDRIEVIEQGTLIQLRVNSVWQGEVDRASSRLLPTPYMQQMMLALCYTRSLRRFLVLGLGAGCLPRALNTILPQATLDVVEIDPDVAHVARRFFSFPPPPAESGMEPTNVRVFIQDGIEFIANPPSQYDAIFVDAFSGAEPPPALVTARTMWHLRNALSPGGVLAINLSRLDPSIIKAVMTNMGRLIETPALFDPLNNERHDDMNLVLLSPVHSDMRRLRQRRVFLDRHRSFLGMDVPQLLANRL